MIKVSIIFPIYKGDAKLERQLTKQIIKQDTKGIKVQTIFVRNMGLAEAYNFGIKKSGGEILITIHQDCILKDNGFIKKMIEPFKDKKVVIATAKIKDNDTGREYFPVPPDGKATAYRKNALNKVRGFDSKTFLTGGEDVDIYLKLMKIGELTKVNTLVEHMHSNYLGNKTFEKRRQNGSINGCLFRIWGIKNPYWWKSLIMCCLRPFDYGKEFIHSFLTRKQDYRRKE